MAALIVGYGTSPYVAALSLEDWTPLATMAAAPGPVRCCACSDDGRLIAVGGGVSPRLAVYDAAFAPVSGTPTIGQAVYAAAFSPEGAYLALGLGAAPWLTVLRTSDWSSVALPAALLSALSTRVGGVAFSPDGNRLAVCTQAAPGLIVAETAGWTAVSGTPSLSGIVYSAAFSPDGSLIAVGRWNGSPSLTVLRTADWTTVSGTPSIGGSGLAVAFSPDGAYLAIGGNAYPTLRVVRTADWSVVVSVDTDEDEVPDTPVPWAYYYCQSVDWSPDGTLLAGSQNQTLPLVRPAVFSVPDWASVSGQPTYSEMRALAFLPDAAAALVSARHAAPASIGYDRIGTRHVSLASLIGPVSGRHVAPSALLSASVTARVSARHAAPSAVAGAAIARHAALYAVSGALSNVSARHAALYAVSGAVSSVSARHAALYAVSGAVSSVSARHAALYAVSGAVSSVSARHAAPSALRAEAVSARHTAPFDGAAVNRACGRHLASWAALNAASLLVASDASVTAPPGVELIVQPPPRLLHNGHALSLVGPIEISTDEGSPFWVCSPELALAEDYAAVQLGDALTLELGGESWALICDGRRYADSEQGPTYHLSAISPAALLGAPWALERTMESGGTSRLLVAGLLGVEVDWRLPEWLVPDEALSASGTPLELARTLCAACGGLLESLPDGSLVARPTYPVSPPDYASADAIQLTDNDFASHAEDADAVQRLNRYTITSETAVDAAGTDPVQIESERVDDDPHHWRVRAYPHPFRAISLAHTGDAATQIGGRESLSETHTELIEIQGGTGSVAYPVDRLLAVDYQHQSLGTLRAAGREITAASGGYAMAWVTYRTRGYAWDVTNALTETIQFLAEE